MFFDRQPIYSLGVQNFKDQPIIIGRLFEPCQTFQLDNFDFKQLFVMMKKARDIKQTRKINQNLFKYINGSKATGLPLQSKTHTRSMMELDSNIRYQQSAREVRHHNKQNHQLSLCNHADEHQNEVKSNSLKKFLSLFGTNPSSNPILNPTGNSMRVSAGKEQKHSARGSNRQVFTCNIKNMNVNMSNSKDKDTLENKSTLVLKKQKTQNNQQIITNLRNENQELKNKLKSTIQQFNSSSQILKDKIKALQTQNASLKKENSSWNSEKMVMEQKFALRQRSLEKTIENLQKNMNRQKCREHDLIIESLKKVINEQLRKIIQLEKFKIERQEIEKLEERINKNMSISSQDSSIRQKTHLMDVKELISMGKRDQTIKIADDSSFSQSALTSRMENSQFQMIEEVEQNQQFSREKSQGQGDSILDEVDKYLVQWRSKH